MLGDRHVVLCALYALLGWGLCRRWRLPTRGAEGFAWAFGLGTGVASLGLLALTAGGAWRALSPSPWGGVAVVAVPALAFGWRWFAALAAPRQPALLPITLGLLVFMMLDRFLLGGSGTDSGWDALAYHLPAAARLATDGAGLMTGLLDGEFRLGFDLLFVPGLDVREVSSTGPHVVHAVAGLALCAAIYAEVEKRTSGVVALGVALLFWRSPGIVSIARHAYVDLGVGLYVFLALAAASKALERDGRGFLVAAGLFAGFAANAKLPAGAAIFAVAAALLAGRGVRRGTRDAAVAVGVALLAAAPWFVRAGLHTGNPFFPALIDRFGAGPFDTVTLAAVQRDVLGQLGLARDVWLPIRGVVRGAFASAGGFEAPAWVVAALPAAFVGRADGARRGLVAGGLVLFVAWGAFVPLFRFGIGLWAWGAVAAALGASRIARVSGLARKAVAVVLFGFLAVAQWSALRRPGDVIGDAEMSAAATVRSRFGPAIAWLRGAPRAPPGPVGLSSSLVALVPGRAISLEPHRNGVLRADDFDDPERLLDGCQRLGLRSLVLDDASVEGRKAIACARVWARDTSLRVLVDEPAAAPGVVVVFLPRDEARR